jgi:hypothetical protein
MADQVRMAGSRALQQAPAVPNALDHGGATHAQNGMFCITRPPHQHRHRSLVIVRREFGLQTKSASFTLGDSGRRGITPSTALRLAKALGAAP